VFAQYFREFWHYDGRAQTEPGVIRMFVALFYKELDLTDNEQVLPSSAHTLVLQEKAGGEVKRSTLFL